MALVITQAGLNKAIAASSQGVSFKITHVGIGDVGYIPDTEQDSLKNEIKRVAISGGKRISLNQIHLTALFDCSDEIIGREIGFYLEDGTLFAVDSDPDIIIMYKSGSNGSRALEAFDLILDSVPADSITVDVTGDLVLNFDKDFEYLYEQVTLLWEEQYPIGAPIPWPTDIAPTGFAIMKGQGFDINTFTKTAKAYPHGILDDMRGLAIVGKKDGELILSYEADGNKAHVHSGRTDHVELGGKLSNVTGNHGHSQNVYAGNDINFGRFPLGTDDQYGGASVGEIAAAGNHQHWTDIGGHSHPITVDSSGNLQTTIQNKKFNWIVRLA